MEVQSANFMSWKDNLNSTQGLTTIQQLVKNDHGDNHFIFYCEHREVTVEMKRLQYKVIYKECVLACM